MNPEMIERSEEVMNAPALNPAQTATPEEMTENQASTMRYIQGPGMVEHHSSEEGSPQTSSDGHRGSFGSIDEYVASTQPGAESTTRSVLGYNFDTTSAGVTKAVEPTITASTAGISIPQPTPLLNPNDQMELDQNFFSFFGDINALSDGGMADLDDWTSLPTDLMGLPDNFNWQGASMADATTML